MRIGTRHWNELARSFGPIPMQRKSSIVDLIDVEDPKNTGYALALNRGDEVRPSSKPQLAADQD